MCRSEGVSCSMFRSSVHYFKGTYMVGGWGESTWSACEPCSVMVASIEKIKSTNSLETRREIKQSTTLHVHVFSGHCWFRCVLSQRLVGLSRGRLFFCPLLLCLPLTASIQNSRLPSARGKARGGGGESRRLLTPQTLRSPHLTSQTLSMGSYQVPQSTLYFFLLASGLYIARTNRGGFENMYVCRSSH